MMGGLYMDKEYEYFVVKCPCCCRQRLFDLLTDSKGIIVIKCQRCSSIIEINLANKRSMLITSEGFKNQTIKCPVCKKQRLFDIGNDISGIVKIKCRRCSEIIKINLERYILY